MANYATENIRTVALVGHGASGKTTLAEALLVKAGAMPAAGSVERGTTVSDFDPLEKQYQHSFRSSLLHCETNGTRIHLIDTPGLSRFHRAVDRRARRRRDGGDRGQRAVRHRDDHVADDGLGGQAQAVPPHRRQQDRRRERRRARGAGRDPGGVRQGMPADQPARRRRQARRRLLLQSLRRRGLLVGGSRASARSSTRSSRSTRN